MRQIRSLKIENFKSIQKLNVEFGEFNVLIGANGSGKSNLVKAIQMISDIRNVGVVAAVANQGWGGSIIPKKYSLDDVGKVSVRLEYDIDLGVPPGGEKLFLDVDTPLARHSICLRFPELDEVDVFSEELKLTKVDLIGQAFMLDEKNPKSARAEKIFNRNLLEKKRVDVTFKKNKLGKVSSKLSRRVDAEDYQRLSHGLGLEFLPSPDGGKEEEYLNNTLSGAFRYQADKYKKKTPTNKSLFEMSGISNFIPSYTRTSDILRKILRYDILLSNIRFEQKASFTGGLQGDGRNLPSVLKRLREDSAPDVWAEISATMSEIAPHVMDIGASNLATGKQYVQFSEFNCDRSVESWDTSDGTLRAVSILVAVEGAQENSVLIIEEPEQNLHPWAISSLIAHIRRAMKRKNLQIFVTTHSQQVLEAVESGEILVASRCLEKGTQFSRLKDLVSDVSNIEMGDIGRLWVKGLLGGVPGDGL